MKPTNKSTEEVVIEVLRRTGSCFLDNLVTSLPNLRWGEVFATVDRMSKDGRLSIRQVSYSAYQITLSGPLTPPPSSIISPLPDGDAPMTRFAA